MSSLIIIHSCMTTGCLVGSPVNSSDIRRASCHRWLSLQHWSPSHQRLESSDQRHKEGWQWSIQVYDQHLSGQEQDCSAQRQRFGFSQNNSETCLILNSSVYLYYSQRHSLYTNSQGTTGTTLAKLWTDTRLDLHINYNTRLCQSYNYCECKHVWGEFLCNKRRHL